MKKLIFAFSMLVAIAGCTKSDKSKAIDAIKLAEKELYASETLNKEKGIALVQQYIDFASQYSSDTLSANYLFKAAEIAMNMKLGSQSILYFDKIITNYPKYWKVAECYFLKAFVFETQLNQLDKAGETYKLFLEKYPNHILAKDARASIEYLGKSDEELIRMFEEKQKATQQ